MNFSSPLGQLYTRCAVFLLSVILSTHSPTLRAGDVVGHVYCGYQGWFNTPTDGAGRGWGHWGDPAPTTIHPSMWPDTRSYYSPLTKARFSSLGNGTPARLFSNAHAETTDTHFYWMQNYGLDGAIVQRFVTGLATPAILQNYNNVLANARQAAELYGRKFYVCYDISGTGSDPNWREKIKGDWMTHIAPILTSIAYAREIRPGSSTDLRPVVQIWGLGFIGSKTSGSVAECLDLINWFKNQGCYVIGGVPATWRSGGSNGIPNWCYPGFFPDVYCSLDMISPWYPGPQKSTSIVDSDFAAYVTPDFAYCTTHSPRIDYQLTIYPGFDFSNADPAQLHNATPRLQGNFFWRQVYNMRLAGISSAQISMFDEYDEGTAIMKAASDASMIPVGQYFQTLSADGIFVSPDFYLRLAGKATRVLKGLEPNSVDVPVPTAASPDWFRSGIEYDAGATPPYTYDPHLTWNNIADWKTNVGPFGPPDAAPICSQALDQAKHRGRGAILCKGTDESAIVSHCYFRAFDVNIPINSNTKLSFWKFSENNLGRYVSIDLIMTDGSNLRDTQAKDHRGSHMHPAAGRGTIGRWEHTLCNIGQWMAGKTIDRILVAYDRAPETGPFIAWIDDIEITDAMPTSVYKLKNAESEKLLCCGGKNNGTLLDIRDDRNLRRGMWWINAFEGTANIIESCWSIGKAVSINTGVTVEQAKLGDIPAKHDGAQQWEFVPFLHQYKLKNVFSSLFLGEFGTATGSKLGQFPESSSRSQLWSIVTPTDADVKNPSNEGTAATLDLGATDVGSFLTRVEGGDGDTTVAVVGQRECRGNLDPISDFYAYFRVSDDFAFSLTDGDITVEIEYWDGPASRIMLQYDGQFGQWTLHPEAIVTQNTGTWKRYRFEIADALFANRQNGGADFRVVYPTPGVLGHGTRQFVNYLWLRPVTQVSSDLGTTDANNSLNRVSSSDGDTIAQTIGGKDCRANLTPAEDFFVYFNISDTQGYGLTGSPASVEVEYWDGPPASISLQYDGLLGPWTLHPDVITTKNTGTWKRYRFHVPDAVFANRQNGGADFRIAFPLSGMPGYGIRQYINKASVSLP